MKVKGQCPRCGEVVEVVALPDAPVIIKEPCNCGVTEATRFLKYAVLGVVSVALTFFGGCWLDNHYTLEAVKAMPDKFKMVPSGIGPVRIEPKAEPK